MGISAKIKSAFRGNVPFHVLAREVLRRRKAAVRRRGERRTLTTLAAAPPRLLPQFAAPTAEQLHKHFIERKTPTFWPANHGSAAELIETANRIVSDSAWELAGFGLKVFTAENVWRRGPISGKDWGLDYHADVIVYENDGSDIRVVWELNRLGHVIPLACAYAATKDEKYAETFFSHVESWMKQNQYGRGANWNCAMEVALRAINLLAAFDIFRRAAACSEERLMMLLQLFDQHGRFIEDNNEFSYLATSNHYLSNVVGLFWIGTLLPELEHAKTWREIGLAEILHEIDVQILPDGADFEASTGYHAFVTQMLLYSFLLAKRNGVDIADKYWNRVHDMLDYLAGIVRPDGGMPLIGDADGSQIVPIIRRDADDQQYLIDLGAAVFGESTSTLEPEVLWLLGSEGINNKSIRESTTTSSAFPDAGAYVLRDGDLYLHFNTNDCGVNGRGSHGHNDALSIEVSAFGRALIIDPGSYVYNLDREARHNFRSTAYHSTVMIDDEEQNTTNADTPFILGNEAKPRVLKKVMDSDEELIIAEHYGYKRLAASVIHRRSVRFDKGERYWMIRDELLGEGEHKFTFRFMLSANLEIVSLDYGIIEASDLGLGVRLLIGALDEGVEIEVQPRWRSSNYGAKVACFAAFSAQHSGTPLVRNWALVPISSPMGLTDGLSKIARLRSSGCEL